MVMENGLDDPRIAERDDIILRKKTRREEAKEAREADQSRDFDPRNPRTVLEELGLDNPDQVDPLGEEHPDRDLHQARLASLRVARQKREEGNHEFTDEQEHRNGLPVPGHPVHEVHRFFGKIRVPDQHELTEADVGPEDRKGEHKLSAVVQMVIVHNPLQHPVPEEKDREDRHHRQRRSKQAGEGIDAEHRREPVRIERHEKVDRGHRKGEREHDEEHRREQLIPDRP